MDAQAFGEGRQQHTLQPITKSIRSRYRRRGSHKDVFKDRLRPIITADKSFANQQNMQYLYENVIDASIPDHQFRSRDPRFANQKRKYGKRQQQGAQSVWSANESQGTGAVEFVLYDSQYR